jgi:EAL domain-containing protein (putative c-di-GMP-specific phosphodiesterase class I)
VAIVAPSTLAVTPVAIPSRIPQQIHSCRSAVIATALAVRKETIRSVWIGLDDLGTVYAPLSYPLTRIKIAWSFIQKFGSHSVAKDAAIVRSIDVMQRAGVKLSGKQIHSNAQRG